MMKLECLPNEILFLCFQFFDALELFHSFDGLNHRFNQLIRQIPLYLNFHYVRKSIFDQFCRRLLFDENIKSQIYSLHLSNIGTTGQINAFLSYFSFDEFPHLQTLTLSEIEEKNIAKFASMLPKMLELRRFHSSNIPPEVLNVLPASKVQALSLNFSNFSRQISSITCLTTNNNSLRDLIYNYFRCLPFLKYLHVFSVHTYDREIENSFLAPKAVYLKQLIIGDNFEILEYLPTLFKCTTNLQDFVISNEFNKILGFNAKSWQQLISSTLPHLKSIKFRMQFYKDIGKKMIEQFQEFQKTFSHEQCSYMVQYELVCGLLKNDVERTKEGDPFYQTSSFFHYRLCINTTNSLKYLFKNWISGNGECQLYKAKIRLLDVDICDYKEVRLLNGIENLKMILDLSHLTHLTVARLDYQKRSLIILLQIFEVAPHLSSLSIEECVLYTCAHDDPLYQYLNRRVRKLNLIKCMCYSHRTDDNQEKVQQISSIFSNIEHLTYEIEETNDIFYVLDHLTKLSTLKITMFESKVGDWYFALKNRLDKYDALYQIQHRHMFEDHVERTVYMWMS